ncbi:MAG: GspH/FimT family pseudopilin [Burkholderiales bacterium]|nr:GspH/FimT family pseudopilin [Burkholderiales bacterium]
MSRAAQSGITLIEVLVAVAIIGIVMALGMPAYSTWIQNTQIRTASETIMSGLQTARNEAIRRNVSVQFMLPVAGSTEWRVNFKSDPDTNPLQVRNATEGSPNATITTQPAGANAVTFSALGRVVDNADASPPLTQIDIDNPKIAVVADRRNLRIIIPTGGAIRLCDPKVAAGDPRAC